MALVMYFWFGMTGVGLLCVGATGWLRGRSSGAPVSIDLADTPLVQVWALSEVLWIGTAAAGIWVWRDELPAAEWARLRRYLRMRLPGQALGLSISR